MIVIGARGITGAKEKFLGSVSNHVMHKSNVPVLVVKWLITINLYLIFNQIMIWTLLIKKL